jgi:hypothetical protein
MIRDDGLLLILTMITLGVVVACNMLLLYRWLSAVGVSLKIGFWECWHDARFC